MGARLGRLLGDARGVVPVLLCALAAHALAYRTFLPPDAVHGYLGIYELVLVAASSVALAAIVVAAGLALTGRRAGRLARSLAPVDDPAPIGYRVATLALYAYALLAFQETTEALVGAARGEPPAFGLEAWLVAVVSLAAVAFVLTLLGRSCRRVLDALLADPCPRATPRPPLAVRPRAPRPPIARRNALAEFRALRAPPAPA